MKTSRKLPLSKGERLIILQAGCKRIGFLPGCTLVFRAKSKDIQDYHTRNKQSSLIGMGGETASFGSTSEVADHYGQCTLSQRTRPKQ